MAETFLTITDLTVIESAQKHEADGLGTWSARNIQDIGWPGLTVSKVVDLGISPSILRLVQKGFVKRTKARGKYLLTEEGRGVGNN